MKVELGWDDEKRLGNGFNSAEFEELVYLLDQQDDYVVTSLCKWPFSEEKILIGK